MPTNILQQRWTAPDSFATTLLTMFADRFGTEGFHWDPNTILLLVEREFQVDLPAANFDRLMAAIALHLSDGFYNDLQTFIDTCNVFSGDLYDPRTWDPADAGECAWGIVEALLLCPPENEEQPFTEEILAYIGKVLDVEGIRTPPAILQMAIRQNREHIDDYSDDPVIFAGIDEFQRSKSSEINATLKRNLRQLIEQLQSLPLRTGDARQIAAEIGKYAA